MCSLELLLLLGLILIAQIAMRTLIVSTIVLLLLLLWLLRLVVMLLVLLLLLMLVHVASVVMASMHVRVLRRQRREAGFIARMASMIGSIAHLIVFYRLPVLIWHPVPAIVLIVSVLLIFVVTPMLWIASLRLIHLVELVIVAAFVVHAGSIASLSRILLDIVILRRHF